MPRTITYSCSVCGIAKQAANRWFVATNTKVGFHLNTWEWAVREERLDDEDVDYVCGQSCCHKLLDSFLQSSLDAETEYTQRHKGEDNGI